MNISNHKKTILIIIAVLLAFFGYWFFFLSKKEAVQPNTTGNLTTQAPDASNTQYDREFVTSLLGLNSVNLDVSIFQSKVYQALSYPEIPFVVNYTRETGRANPFLPIGVEPGSGAQTVTTQTNVTPAATTTSNSTTTTPRGTGSSTPNPTPKTF